MPLRFRNAVPARVVDLERAVVDERQPRAAPRARSGIAVVLVLSRTSTGPDSAPNVTSNLPPVHSLT